MTLDAYLDLWRGRAFDWPTANCCHFAAGWVAIAEGGRDPLTGLPATPSARHALRLVQRLGGLAAAISAQLDREPLAPALATVGDIVLLGRRAGICNGRLSAFAAAPAGIGWMPTAQAQAAWRVQPCAA